MYISRWSCPQKHITQVEGIQRPECCREHGCGAKELVMEYAGADYQRHPLSFGEAMAIGEEPDPDPKPVRYASNGHRTKKGVPP